MRSQKNTCCLFSKDLPVKYQRSFSCRAGWRHSFMHLVHRCHHQQLQGALPDSFGSLASLVSLDISKNQLAGEPFAVIHRNLGALYVDTGVEYCICCHIQSILHLANTDLTIWCTYLLTIFFGNMCHTIVNLWTFSWQGISHDNCTI